ncbi:SMI1/KNR4 family protein [Streptomyces sp. NPDC102340]|uniref:SMI1/KNR4 family protein n=1 Tax=unclassified Streptomyces TaxID=2593676 RepID=UPI002E265388
MSDDIRHAQAIEERQVADAWRRIQSWLHQHAPATTDKLLPGASDAEIDALQQELGVRIPAGLRALWRHCPGVQPGPWVRFLLGNWTPMKFDSVIRKYWSMLEMQQHEDELNNRRSEPGEEFLLWRASWVPFCSDTDRLFGLCLDAETGKLWSWSKYAERAVEFESLSCYLEEMADVLEVPSLATGAKPGLIDGALTWGTPTDPDEQALWRPLAR